MSKLFKRLRRRSGTSTVEYGIVAGLVAVVLIITIALMGDSITALFNTTSNTVDDVRTGEDTGSGTGTASLIAITGATWGGNCGGGSSCTAGNVTAGAATSCNGQSSCAIDPADLLGSDCDATCSNKDLVVDLTCNGTAKQMTFGGNGSEAGGHFNTVSCP